MEFHRGQFPEESNEFPWDNDALEAFKSNIIKQDIKCRMDDIFLLGFLRAKKYDLEASLQLLKNYYSTRIEPSTYRKFIKDLVPSKLEKMLSLKVMQFLPKPNQNGQYVFIAQLSNWDISIAGITDYFRSAILHFDFQLNFHRSQEKGVILIINGEGLTLSHLLQFTPKELKFWGAIVFGNSYPLSFEIHYVNVNVILKAIVTILFPFFSQKIKEKVFFHSEMDTLHKYVHPEYLPQEYGGKLPPFDPTESNQLFLENEEFFRMNEKYLKLFEENNKSKTDEKRFPLFDEDESVKNILKISEGKYKLLEEDPKSYLTMIEKEKELEVKRL